MAAVNATLDMAAQAIRVDAAALVVAVADGPPDSVTFLAGALAARIGAVVAGYCQRHQINAAGLAVNVEVAQTDGSISAVAVTVTLPNADGQKRLTALAEIAAGCVPLAVPVGVTIIDRITQREKALAFATETAVVVDEAERGLQKA